MENSNNYYNERNKDLILKIREITSELPAWFADYIRSIEPTTSSLTRYNYCCDARIFLNYLTTEVRSIAGTPIAEITPEMIDSLSLRDLEIYIDHLGFYLKAGKDDNGQIKEVFNSEYGKARKLASLRSMFKYLYKHQHIKENPAALLDTPKIYEKAIIRLDPDEAKRLIEVIRSGEGLSEAQLRYHKKTVKRDVAICMLFLTTGIRVSELVGMNISSVDLESMSFVVTRKGGDQAILYFDYETLDALDDYLEERKSMASYSLDAPLFLSLQNKRMTVLSVENMVKKFAKIAAPLKKITPHKLRSTYGTMLYSNTGDIYLVADVLGHKDVNTTRRHYAHMLEDQRKKASKAVRIFDEEDSEE
ncbi:MAG: integrase [Clostridiales bacterium]|nr:integrase [Clostridiales bacterium]